SIVLTVIGGVEPYSYSWKHSSASTQALTGLSLGDYEVTVRDENGCETSKSVKITQPILYGITKVKLVRPSNDTTNDGSMEVIITGGYPPYEYHWKNELGESIKKETNSNSIQSKIEGLTEGVYTIEITDNKNCIIKETYNLANPGELLVSVTQLQEITCYNASNAILDVIAVGGIGGNNYVWYDANTKDAVGTEKKLVGVPAGDYYVIVSNAEGIEEQSAIFNVNQPEEIRLQINETHLSCYEANNGSVNIEIEGGSGEYEFRYRNKLGFNNWISVLGSTTKIENLSEGKYTIQLKDSNNCFAINSTTGTIDFEIEIMQPAILELVSDLVNDAKGYGLSNGSIETEFKGGTLPYTYQWTDSTGKILSETSNTISGLIAGTYSLIIRDSKDCSLSFVYEVEQPDELEVSIEEKSIISCQGSNDGVLQAKPIGGVLPYKYEWYKEGSTVLLGDESELASLENGVYYVKIIDANNNKVSSSRYTLTEPELLELFLESDYVLCGTGNDWTIESIVKGGTAPYTYLWSTGTNTVSLQGVKAGSYMLTVVDANGC
ncbi:SprB repeat-containing protein, partial [Tenacibaculum sp. S7007]